MSDWPHTIPYDLRKDLEAAGHDDWQRAFRGWAKIHQLKLKLLWDADLLRGVGELDQWRWAPKEQDRWTAIREWLVAFDVPVPVELPVRPERPSDLRGH